MSPKQWLAVAAWVFVPVAASAQQPDSSPLNPNAPAGTIGYESAFKNFRSSNDEGETPDKIWRVANEEMGKLGGHAGHMKNTGSQPSASSGENNAGTKQDRAAEHAKHH